METQLKLNPLVDLTGDTIMLQLEWEASVGHSLDGLTEIQDQEVGGLIFVKCDRSSTVVSN